MACCNTASVMKHPTQDPVTSRAYIVSDNCPWHISSCRTAKWKDWPPIKSQLSTHTISSAATCTYPLSLSHTYTHIPIGRQLSYFCHCTVTIILTQASWECSGIPGGTLFSKVKRRRAQGNLSSSSALFPKVESLSSAVFRCGYFWCLEMGLGSLSGRFYWCQLRGQICDYRQGSDILERSELGQWERSKEHLV